MAVRNRVVHIVDHMEQHYLTMGGWTPGLRVPPPLPPPRWRLRALLRAQGPRGPAPFQDGFAGVKRDGLSAAGAAACGRSETLAF